MPRRDEPTLSPEAQAALATLDAALDGRPTPPEHAELAELALILRDQRPAPRPDFVAGLDARAARRFRGPAGAAAAERAGTAPADPAGVAPADGPGVHRALRPRRARRRRWWWASGATAAALAGVAVVAVISVGGGSLSGPAGSEVGTSAVSSSSTSVPAPASSAAPAAASAAASAGGQQQAQALSAGQPERAPAPSPVPSPGRQVVQSAELQLSAAPARIDDVAQQVFDVIGAEHGIVQNSTVSASGSQGSAEFQLSVPSSALAATMTALSQLRGAQVVSRSDATTDITGQVGGAGERLAEARALRRSLLTRLAAATTSAQVTSLQAQLHDADAVIAADQAALQSLKHQVASSTIALTIQAGSAPAPVASSSFTLSRAAHDAGRVLVVVAGVALIALAVLVPLALVASLGGWALLALRRRRREQALDLV